jgi:hypothetical protein
MACKAAAARGQPSYERTPEHREMMRARFKGRPAIPHAVVAAAAARRGVPPSDLARHVASERWTAEGNPKWKDGRSAKRYAPGFYGRRLRNVIIERDKVCVDCGQWDERPRAMHIHHVDGGKTDHSPENCVLLCIGCHHRRHREARAAA